MMKKIIVPLMIIAIMLLCGNIIYFQTSQNYHYNEFESNEDVIIENNNDEVELNEAIIQNDLVEDFNQADITEKEDNDNFNAVMEEEVPSLKKDDNDTKVSDKKKDTNNVSQNSQNKKPNQNSSSDEKANVSNDDKIKVPPDEKIDTDTENSQDVAIDDESDKVVESSDEKESVKENEETPIPPKETEKDEKYYQIKKSVFSTVEDCNEKGMEIALSDTVNILGNTCFSVSYNGEIIGYDLYIRYADGRFEKYNK